MWTHEFLLCSVAYNLLLCLVILVLTFSQTESRFYSWKSRKTTPPHPLKSRAVLLRGQGNQNQPMKLQWQLSQGWPQILDLLDCCMWESVLQSVNQMPSESPPVLTAGGSPHGQPACSDSADKPFASDWLIVWLGPTWTCLVKPALLSSETEGQEETEKRLLMLLKVASQCLRSYPRSTAHPLLFY